LCGKVGHVVRSARDFFVGGQQLSHASRLILLSLQERGDQVPGEHTGSDVGRASDDFGSVHANASKLDRERRLFPLIL
jgi:hypothetical protein